MRECSSKKEQGKELLKVIESMMMDYINYREKDAENGDDSKRKLSKNKEEKQLKL
ncbi:hypothetical protein [Priestia megaterium]|uniref:hypothetical protein n=1 Tax=Priestia megaterium TaxID=1404 RepID=UPI0013751864|nr:hypothetical protein [Priestia megaterium]MDH3170145.1 hypothetical protein [Priestia megaterium]